MTLCDSVAHDQSAGWEAHIHTPGDDECDNEGLCPVDLVGRHCCDENAADCECAHGDEHDPTGTDTRDDMASGDGGDETRNGDGAELSHGEKWGGSSELLKDLDVVVDEDA